MVSYFSATYGCDVTTPPQEIHADHVNMIRPADRKASAYDFFYRVYRDNPILEEQMVTRDNVIAGLRGRLRSKQRESRPAGPDSAR